MKTKHGDLVLGFKVHMYIIITKYINLNKAIILYNRSTGVNAPHFNTDKYIITMYVGHHPHAGEQVRVVDMVTKSE